jgi:hypothetical protein
MSSIFRRLTLATTSSGASQTPATMILPVIDRLRQALDEENGDIAKRGPVDYHAYNMRKSQGLLEMNRLAPAFSNSQAAPALQTALADLHAKLEANRRMLRTQLKAAQTIANIIARAIRDGQSDGTYSARLGLDRDE